MIRFTCDCGQTLEVSDDTAGKKARCPKCDRILPVPTTSVQVEPPQPGGPLTGAIQAEPEGAPASSRQAREGVQDDVPEERAPRRRRAGREDEREPVQAVGSGKATTSLVLGLLSILCGLNILTGLPGLIVGIMALGEINQGRATGKGMAVAGVTLSLFGMVGLPLLLLGLLLPAVAKVRESAARMSSSNNLKQMGIAMHNYHDAMGQLPQNGVGPMGAPPRGPQDKPLLSWRVAILPYIEQNNLYNQFNLNEPWDSPTNIRLLPIMPKTYMIPGKQPTSPGMTHYQVFTGPGTMFEPGVSLRLFDVADGLSNTIMIVEAANEVPWTKPEDLPFDPKAPLPPLGGHFSGGFNVLLGDGNVRFLPAKTPETTLKALITRNGGESIPLP